MFSLGSQGIVVKCADFNAVDPGLQRKLFSIFLYSRHKSFNKWYHNGP